MKLEATDRKNPYLICPATIGDVKGDQIYVTFDGWSGTFDYWCKYDSREIFPVGWCCLTGEILQRPGTKGKLISNYVFFILMELDLTAFGGIVVSFDDIKTSCPTRGSGRTARALSELEPEIKEDYVRSLEGCLSIID